MNRKGAEGEKAISSTTNKESFTILFSGSRAGALFTSERYLVKHY